METKTTKKKTRKDDSQHQYKNWMEFAFAVARKFGPIYITDEKAILK